MKCLILAAGRGSRLRQRADSKPLLPLLGLPLIERGIRAAHMAGADHFIVVTGYQAATVEAFLQRLSRRLRIPIETVFNPNWASRENGHSVLAAANRLDGPFLLLMADHIFDPALLQTLIRHGPPASGVALAVDGALDNPLVDLDDVTRVRRKGEAIIAIGKHLESYDGYDTGAFLATPTLFTALEQATDSSLSAAVQILAQESRACAVDVSGRFWIDVDDEAALKRAEQALLDNAGGKTADGPVSRWLNRPLSIRLSRRLARWPVTPNQISLLSFALSLLAAALLFTPGWATLALGGLLAQVASIIDGCDGEIARLKFQGSDYGGWFDAVLDRYADAALLFGMSWHAWRQSAWDGALVIGFLAIIGSFMVSYTADKYDGLMRQRGGARFRLGRDVRVLILCIGALLNQALATLALIALVMNAESLRRILVCRHD